MFSFYVCGFLFKFLFCSLLLSLFWQFNSLILAKMLSLFELFLGSVGRWDFEFYDSLSYGFSWPKTMKKFPPTPTSCYIYNSSSCIHIPLDERKLSGWPSKHPISPELISSKEWERWISSDIIASPLMVTYAVLIRGSFLVFSLNEVLSNETYIFF